MHPSLLLQEFCKQSDIILEGTMLLPITGNVLTASLVSVLFGNGVSLWVSFSFFPFDLLQDRSALMLLSSGSCSVSSLPVAHKHFSALFKFILSLISDSDSWVDVTGVPTHGLSNGGEREMRVGE